MAAEDWVVALRGFPQSVVSDAVNEWIRNGTHRPSPGHIVKLCRERMPRAPKALALPVPDRREPTAEEKARVQALIAQAGFKRMEKVEP